MLTESSTGSHCVQPSVEALLIRAADTLESHLTQTPAAPPAAWCRETMNGLRAISLLSQIWIDVEIRVLLNRQCELSPRDHSHLRYIVASVDRLRALIGTAELQMGGLDPTAYPEDADAEIVAGLRLSAWRIVAGIAVLHAFLCLLRRRDEKAGVTLLVAIV